MIGAYDGWLKDVNPTPNIDTARVSSWSMSAVGVTAWSSSNAAESPYSIEIRTTPKFAQTGLPDTWPRASSRSSGFGH